MGNFTPIHRYTKNRSKSVSHFVISQERDTITYISILRACDTPFILPTPHALVPGSTVPSSPHSSPPYEGTLNINIHSFPIGKINLVCRFAQCFLVFLNGRPGGSRVWTSGLLLPPPHSYIPVLIHCPTCRPLVCAVAWTKYISVLTHPFRCAPFFFSESETFEKNSEAPRRFPCPT